MLDGELYPFLVIWGLGSLLVILIAYPLWMFSEVSSLRKSIHFLREDIEMQANEISQLRDQLSKTSQIIEQTKGYGL